MTTTQTQPAKITKPKTLFGREENCGNCRFYVDGFCQRFPPVVIVENGTALRGCWPGVGRADWCGEWKP